MVKAEIFKKDGTKETWSYTYDALGRRIGKGRLKNEEVSGSLENQTRFVWDGSHLLQEIHPDGRYTYIYTDPDSYEPLAQIRDWTTEDGEKRQQTHYFHCDQIGIPREMTDKDGNLLWFGNYTGWGRLKEETKVTDSAYQPFRLQNQYCDEETGLHYNFFRYYEPECGRFINQDPIGLMGGSNFYQFAPNTQTWFDLFGLSATGAVLSGLGVDLTIVEPTDAVPQKWAGWGIALALAVVTDAGIWVYSKLQANSKSQAEERQREYEIAKNFCDTPPQPGDNKCATLHRQIEHAKKCIELYEEWDKKWLPGRHAQKIQERKNRLNNLKEEHKKNCVTSNK